MSPTDGASMLRLTAFLKWPDTKSGKWAVYAIFGFFGSLVIFYGLVAAGLRGGETFFSNPALAIPILLAASCGIASAFLAFWALVFKKDRKLLLAMCLLVGAFVLYFTIGELIGHD